MNTSAAAPAAMPDVQSSQDTRQVPIQRVGIRSVRHPLQVASASGAQATVGDWTLTVALPATEKGTHMSRFIALLEQYRSTPLDRSRFGNMASEMLELLHAEKGDIEVSFPYFVEKAAPISGVRSLLDYQVNFLARASREHGVDFVLTVLVPVTSLCPCSKTISEYGAHNQRSHVTVKVLLDSDIDLDQLIGVIEREGSCELWGLLKRPDEKYVTERAYDNPKFVEDLVRDVAVRVAAQPGVRGYQVQAENFESIHNHSAYAVVEGGTAI
ncbi:GTP cyclohydrolase FolE2 [Corticimicrobacter populi]|uniref:GTP cyclohydrolase FolE2 n=1 Tax=Corticimicrobacter populi TaxID=2175229 RepID=A0A2V1K2X6_9BURK|nr:GTP cyclohydrolase FolE2 [Corticimicrobacter populi]PWF25441.1 GTP cyclohydrolase I FolE2 [Corticimicrobacter populi]